MSAPLAGEPVMPAQWTEARPGDSIGWCPECDLHTGGDELFPPEKDWRDGDSPFDDALWVCAPCHRALTGWPEDAPPADPASRALLPDRPPGPVALRRMFR